MKDFTVKTYGSSLPKSLCSFEDEIDIKFAIWDNIQQGFSNFIESDDCHSDIDRTIVSIDLARLNCNFLNQLKELDKISSEIELYNLKLQNSIKSAFWYSYYTYKIKKLHNSLSKNL